MSTLDKIKNPASGKWVNLSGRKGRYVLENYLASVNMLGGARLKGPKEQYINTILKLVKKNDTEKYKIENIPRDRKRAILFIGKDSIDDIDIRDTIGEWTKKDLQKVMTTIPSYSSYDSVTRAAILFSSLYVGMIIDNRFFIHFLISFPV